MSPGYLEGICFYLFALLNSFLRISCCSLLRETHECCVALLVALTRLFVYLGEIPSGALNVLPVGWASLPCASSRGAGKSQGDFRHFCGVGSKGLAQLLPLPDKLKPCETLLLLCLPGALFGSSWSTRPEGKGTQGGAQAEAFNPNWSVILGYPVLCRLLDRVYYFLELSHIRG